MEVWKDIKGYEGKYQVSNFGRVKSKERKHRITIKGTPTFRHQKERMLKPWKRDKYLLVDLWDNGRRDIRSIHVLVYENFNDCSCSGLIVLHKDKNKNNNYLSNLECLTILQHNRFHFNGHTPWNKGKKMPPEVHQKVWATRRAKNNKGVKDEKK